MDRNRREAEQAEKNGQEPPHVHRDHAPLVQSIPLFQAAADEYKGTDSAIPFLLWIWTEAAEWDPEAGKRVIETLCEEHIQSAALEPLRSTLSEFTRILGPERGRELLERIESQSPLPRLRGWATYALVGDTLENYELGSEGYEATKKRLRDAGETAQDAGLLSRIQSKIRIREVFGLGMVAPDIEGVDLDGVAFKLSDYEGKVLFVDFWGNW